MFNVDEGSTRASSEIQEVDALGNPRSRDGLAKLKSDLTRPRVKPKTFLP